ncbi:hypothetical protein SAMN04487758_10676 [Enterococcus mundtii]|nr:hypothetical protein SAMN04487758_10676 [Enterococcus mundtii]
MSKNSDFFSLFTLFLKLEEISLFTLFDNTDLNYIKLGVTDLLLA